MEPTAGSSFSVSSNNGYQFPYKAYEIQENLMNAIYDTIEASKIGLFESPTGTGKTLSIICGSMKWLRDHKDEPLVVSNDNPKSNTNAGDSGLPSWVVDHIVKEQAKKQEKTKIEHISNQEEYQKRLKRMRQGFGFESEPSAKRHKSNSLISVPTSSSSNTLTSSDSNHFQDSFLIEDYDSDKEGTDELERKLWPENKPPSADFQNLSTRKIFYSSRTHSQLSQFVQELLKTTWSQDVRMVIVGSRKTMCINPEVLKLGLHSAINDKCLDMVTTVTKPSNDSIEVAPNLAMIESPFGRIPDEPPLGCRFYHSQRNQNFRDSILSEPRDIEELVELGTSVQECPYYASRAAIQNAEIVLAPYPSILHKATRQALGIDLRENIVILDEAHNIIDTVNAVYSVEISLHKLGQSLSQLESYRKTYCSRLKLKNLSYLDKLVSVHQILIKYLAIHDPGPNNPSSSSSVPIRQSSIKTLNDFLFESRLDNHNLYKLDQFVKETRLDHKLRGFCQSQDVEVSIMKQSRRVQIHIDESDFQKHNSALRLIMDFLSRLTSDNSDGRIIVQQDSQDPKSTLLKFVLLNPEIHFQDIISEARCVILAGGTMKPFDDFTTQLLPSNVQTDLHPKLNPQRISTFSCSHIIPDSNLTSIVFTQGPANVEFNFTFEERNGNYASLDEVASVLYNLCNVVPDGIVLFSPSYLFEKELISRWQSTGDFDRIDQKKKIFREPKESSQVESVLRDYENLIHQCSQGTISTTVKQSGAIISCVVGGKLSEGINFKDGLGRGIVMVGLPYPNIKDPLLIERFNYIQRKHKANGTVSPTNSELYQNLCMKAVNQSIGRAIRHINDYAIIALLDKRYSSSSIQSKLPDWIKRTTRVTESFGEGFKAIATFFRARKNP